MGTKNLVDQWIELKAKEDALKVEKAELKEKVMEAAYKNDDHMVKHGTSFLYVRESVKNSFDAKIKAFLIEEDLWADYSKLDSAKLVKDIEDVPGSREFLKESIQKSVRINSK